MFLHTGHPGPRIVPADYLGGTRPLISVRYLPEGFLFNHLKTLALECGRILEDTTIASHVHPDATFPTFALRPDPNRTLAPTAPLEETLPADLEEFHREIQETVGATGDYVIVDSAVILRGFARLAVHKNDTSDPGLLEALAAGDTGAMRRVVVSEQDHRDLVDAGLYTDQ